MSQLEYEIRPYRRGKVAVHVSDAKGTTVLIVHGRSENVRARLLEAVGEHRTPPRAPLTVIKGERDA